MSKFNFKTLSNSKFPELSLSVLDTSMIDGKYFIIDIWDTSKTNPEQVLLRMNNLDVLNIEENVINFKVTDELFEAVHTLESQHIIKLCVPHVKKLKLSNMQYNSLVSDHKVGDKIIHVMKFQLNNQDYNPVFYADGNVTDFKCFHNAQCRIVAELVGIQFDLESNTIVPDFRLRQVAKNKKTPKRMVLSEYSLADDSENDTHSHNNTNNNSTSHSDTDDSPPDMSTKDVYVTDRNIEVSDSEDSEDHNTNRNQKYDDSEDNEDNGDNEDNEDSKDNEDINDDETSDTSDDGPNMNHLFNILKSLKRGDNK